MGAAFGGGSSQTLFGSSGAGTFLSKATTAAAIIFMVTSFTLAFVSSKQTIGSSVLEGESETRPAAEEQPDNEQTGAESGSAEPQVVETRTVKIPASQVTQQKGSDEPAADETAEEATDPQTDPDSNTGGSEAPAENEGGPE